MSQSDDSRKVIAARFRAVYLHDHEQGCARELAEYLAGEAAEHHDIIAAEYVILRGLAAPADGNDARINAENRSGIDTGRPSTQPGPTGSDTLGHYRILRSIGRGGQATVYLAEDLNLPRQVALKVLDPGRGSSRPVLERFRREAEITSRLNHPAICQVYEFGDDRGALWIAMRYVEGETLRDMISTARSRDTVSSATWASPEPQSGSTPHTWPEIEHLLSLFERVARALHVAHEGGVIHRDIKPGNIMVTKEGDPVLLDFGLAQDLEGTDTSLTVTGELMGTPHYMSPEQLAANRIRLDRRTDVYSLGVTLFECLTNHRPFEAPTRDGLYKQILTKDPPDVRRLNPGVPGDLRVVLETALEKDCDRRYQSALDFADDIERVRHFQTIRAKPAGPVLRLRRWRKRNPVLATAIIGCFLCLVAGLVVALVLLAETRRQRDATTRERDAKDRALAEVVLERNAKEASIADYDRLGDLPRLERLKREADDLWPALPSRVPALKAWLAQAAELEKHLAGHVEARDRLRASPTLQPYSDADRTADAEAHGADASMLEQLRLQRALVARLVESQPVEPGGQFAKLDLEIARLEARCKERLTWKFESNPEQFKHDTTAKLVDELSTLLDPDPAIGLRAAMQSRLDFAESVKRETLDKYEARWQEAIRSIADESECPAYRGLTIAPQLGLIPIGRDRASGLWEFLHFRTASPGPEGIPKRNKQGGLLITEASGLVFVLIPAGTFRMGAVREVDEDSAAGDTNVDAEALPHESPVVERSLDAFFISKYEMTQPQWFRATGKKPSGFCPGGASTEPVDLRHPVEQVSWDDADRWLPRIALVLPTEAQWEYAARAGTTTPRWTGTGPEGLQQAANLADASCRRSGGDQGWKYEAWDDGHPSHAAVGSFAANQFGLHDVLGNVSEWCLDPFGPYSTPLRSGDGLRQIRSGGRVVRGGAFNDDASAARSSYRFSLAPEIRSINLGVRPARPVER